MITVAIVTAIGGMLSILKQSEAEGYALLMIARTILGGFVDAFCFFAIDAGLKTLMG